MFSRFNEEAQKVLLMTKKEMDELKHPYVGSEHLLLSILHNNDLEITGMLNKCGITYDKCKSEIINVIGMGTKTNEWVLYTPLLKRIIEEAIMNNKDLDTLITVEDLFLALLSEGEGVANRILLGMNIDIDYLYEQFSSRLLVKNNRSSKLLVEEYAVDFNKKFNTDGFDPVVGRDRQVNKIIEILLRRTKNNPLLIGEAGVGKTAIVEELVRRIEMSDVPKKLFNKRVLCVSMAGLVAGTKYRGEFEERINQLVAELENEPNIILFIDEIHTLVGAGGAEGAIDAANILKPYLARGKIRIIGATTKEEYSKYIEKDKALDRRFQKVYVMEPTNEETINILYELRDSYQKFHNVSVDDNLIQEIVRLSDLYIHNGKFPDKAIDVFDDVCAKASVVEDKIDEKLKSCAINIKNIKNEKKQAIIEHDYKEASELKNKELVLENEYNNLIVKRDRALKNKKATMQNLYDVIYERSKIPVQKIRGLNGKALIRSLKNKVIGQDRIIEEIVNITCSNSNQHKNRPMSFLLIGKSGLGKTFLVKEYAKELYNKDSFIKLDMSEYSDSFSASKIIGSPPGYVGYDERNILLDRIKYNPYSVLLLDEIEKASPRVLKLFLQVFDEGVMTCSNGESVDFSNVTIFMTSNLGCEKGNLGFSNNVSNALILKVRGFLGDELFNRIDKVFVFKEFDEKAIEKIISKKLTDYVEKEKISKDISPEIVNKIKIECDYKNFGARKIERVIEKILSEVTV